MGQAESQEYQEQEEHFSKQKGYEPGHPAQTEPQLSRINFIFGDVESHGHAKNDIFGEQPEREDDLLENNRGYLYNDEFYFHTERRPEKLLNENEVIYKTEKH